SLRRTRIIRINIRFYCADRIASVFPGVTRLGTAEANVPQDIQLSGSHILSEHCIFENTDGVICLIPHAGALVYVNGREVTEPIILKTGSRVILGKNHVFRFTHPGQPREEMISNKAVDDKPGANDVEGLKLSPN
ncbi:hypothetical protein KGM_210566B, partial [Danaus plexippus plexippus]